MIHKSYFSDIMRFYAEWYIYVIGHCMKQFRRQRFINSMVINLNFSKALPPRSKNITSSDFWLWIFMKDNSKIPPSAPDLKHKIHCQALDNLAESQLRKYNPLIRAYS